MKAVHYLNQFFAGLGGEDKAETPPTRLDGAVGPGRGLAAELEGVEIVATIACGDDYFAEHEDEALAHAARLPGGRSRPTCSSRGLPSARAATATPAGRSPPRPPSAASLPSPPCIPRTRGWTRPATAYVVPTAVNVAGMRDALPRLARLPRRLPRDASSGRPTRRATCRAASGGTTFAEKTGAERAVELLLAKLGGETRTEVGGDSIAWSRRLPVADLSDALVALVTEAGCVPQGNPDHLPVRAGAGVVPLRPRRRGHACLPARYESVHGGFDVTLANEDPNRLVPLDTVREPRARRPYRPRCTRPSTRRRATGRLSSSSTRFGQEIAGELREAGVSAVLLSGT